MGKIGKFYSENCLLKQAFVKDDTQTVEQVIGKKFKVVRFVRWEMGEGIEKKQENLQDEVAKQVEAMKKNWFYKLNSQSKSFTQLNSKSLVG